MRRRWFLVAVPVAFVAMFVGAWAVDSARADDKVMRNTELGDTAVGGKTEPEVEDVVDELAASLATQQVRIDTGDRTIDATAGRLGLGIDEAATVEAALDAGGGSPLTSPFRWLGSFFNERTVDVVYDLDQVALAASLTQLDEGSLDPVEPTIRFAEGEVVTVPGKPGQTLDPERVGAALLDAAQEAGIGEDAITFEVDRTDVPPTFTDEQADAVAAEANERIATPLELRAGERTATAGPVLQGLWATTDVVDGDLVLAYDEQRITESLPKLFPDDTAAGKDATFVILDNKVVILGAEPPEVCCAPNSTAQVLAALRNDTSTVDLQLVKQSEEKGLEWARSLGIKEKVAEFTTRHKCCEARVTNIHKIAVDTRGKVILPGETWSLNDAVGQRTRAGGYVEAGAIIDGRLDTAIGGGVSQYTTTLFNAAFFAGLDYAEYQSHSLYFDRYPYGREATLNWRSPDLKIVNDTPYGVLIWPVYTDTSITVQLWSTRYVTGEQTGQREVPDGRCTKVITERTRRYVDGRVDVDYVTARYRPREGVNCFGPETTPEPDDERETPPTTAKPTPTPTPTTAKPTPTTAKPTPTTAPPTTPNTTAG